MASMSEFVPRYEEVERCDSWGAARVKQRALEETYGKGSILIFKDLSARPFVALMKGSYIVALKKGHKPKEGKNV